MKVVLFCGGRGIKVQDFSEKIPKPLISIGSRPLIWHVMKYYAHFGHTDFILCLGFKGNLIKDYFVNYKEYVSNDFILRAGSRIDLFGQDIKDWKITFVDTGNDANTAERLLAVRKHLEREETFMVNYADGLTDMDLADMSLRFEQSSKTAMLMVTTPKDRFHLATVNEQDNSITGITTIGDIGGLWTNAGYYIFRQEIFNHIDTGNDLPESTFRNLVALKQLAAYPYRGMFLSLDTFREKQALEDMYAGGDAPWQIWKDSDLPA